MKTNMDELLTLQSAEKYLEESDRIITIDRMTDQESGPIVSYYFFTNNHTFNLHGELSPEWVPVTTHLPMQVAPREGMEDGVIYDVATYRKVFHKHDILISSLEQLHTIVMEGY